MLICRSPTAHPGSPSEQPSAAARAIPTDVATLAGGACEFGPVEDLSAGPNARHLRLGVGGGANRGAVIVALVRGGAHETTITAPRLSRIVVVLASSEHCLACSLTGTSYRGVSGESGIPPLPGLATALRLRRALRPRM